MPTGISRGFAARRREAPGLRVGGYPAVLDG